jgi:hypothetical protein
MSKTKSTRRIRSPNLDSDRVNQIAGIVRKLNGHPTWQIVCEEVERQTGHKYTRQALAKYESIQMAYQTHHDPHTPTSDMMPTMSRARRKRAERLRRLRRRVKELEKTRDMMLERFARWVVNAAGAGLTEEFLNQPLGAINRSEGFDG